MAEIADLYEETRSQIIEQVRDLDDESLARPVPATPGWTIKDVVAHLTGDAACVIRADFPREFFAAFGDPAAVEVLNAWTAKMVDERRDRSLDEIIDEWDREAAVLTDMMRSGEWPNEIPMFADRVMLTDLTVHQQDLNGALGIEAERDGVPIKLGVGGYIGVMGLRLQSDGGPTLRLVTPEKTWLAGVDEPAATVTATRFEFFRALSGRRSWDQVLDYDWAGDPEPFRKYFFPYGERDEALAE